MQNVNKKTIFWDIGNVLIQSVHKPLFGYLLRVRKSKLSDDQLHTEFAKIIDYSFYGKIDLQETWDRLQYAFGIENNQLKKNSLNISTEV